MVSQLCAPTQSDIIYPDSDGQPMANNTTQFRWILVIQQNLDWLYADNPDCFVAGDLFWYPIEGNNKVVNAPDIMVVFGRPKGERGSYKQWEEDNIAPQVVFEILSPSNTTIEMARKLLFYERYGVEEYYLYDPQTHQLQVWLRGEYGLDAVEWEGSWTSPRLKVRFEVPEDGELVLYRPDGETFRSYLEIAQRLQQAEQQVQQTEQVRRDAVVRLLGMGLTTEQIAEALDLAVEEVQAIATHL